MHVCRDACVCVQMGMDVCRQVYTHRHGPCRHVYRMCIGMFKIVYRHAHRHFQRPVSKPVYIHVCVCMGMYICIVMVMAASGTLTGLCWIGQNYTGRSRSAAAIRHKYIFRDHIGHN